MMSRRSRRIAAALMALVVTFSGILFGQRAGAAGTPRDEHWPFAQNPRSVWERAMTPHAGTASFLVNNRPVYYSDQGRASDEHILEEMTDGDILKMSELKAVDSSVRLSELFIRHALSVAHHHSQEFPWDVVQCCLSLGALYYQQGKYAESERYFEEALTRAKLVRGEGHPDIADINDFLATVHRATREFDRAEELYKDSIRIREHVLGADHREVAASYHHLAMLYTEAGRKEEAAALAKAQEIMGASAFISRTLSDGPRPVSTCMPCKASGAGELKAMVAMANDVLLKHPPSVQPPVGPRKGPSVVAKEPGLVTIVGTWRVPTDEVKAARTRTIKQQDETLQGTEDITETRHEDDVSAFENVPIYLCDAKDAQSIGGQVSRYAQEHGLDPQRFGKDWPSVHRQAVAVKQMMDGVAQSRRIDVTRTDKLGEYEIGSVPKGSYVLYASLQTASQVLFWLSSPIAVSRKGVVTYDFNQDSATVAMFRRESAPRISKR